MSLSTQALSAPRIGLRARSTTHWWLGREAAFNWLAFGLLLTAWNAVDDGGSRAPRPGKLRGYDAVSVRAVHRAHAEP